MDLPLSLVVDDEPAVRTLVASMLQREGFRTVEAEDGIEALAILRGAGEAIRMVVSDLRMPKMGGQALARVVRQEYPAIPILLMTGYCEEPNHQGLPLITKPFTAAEFKSAVRRVLDPESTRA